MYGGREVYPNAPFQFVVAEIRFPYAPRLRQQDTLDRVQIALEPLVPIRQVDQVVNVRIGPGESSGQTSEHIIRLLNRAATCSVSFQTEAIRVETTHYEEFSRFLDLITATVRAVADEHAVPAVSRLGLRYIDEIRVPEQIKDVRDWEHWVSTDLVKIPGPRDLPVRQHQGLVQYETGDDTALRLQFSARDGASVIADGPLKRRGPVEAGPFFALDIDSFWDARSPEKALDFDAVQIETTLTRLHRPTGEVFQRALTDRLRELFRGVDVISSQ